MRRAPAAVATALLMLATGCAPAGPGDGGGQLTVFAAASLRDAFESLADAYEDATDTRLVLSFDASSALRTQVIEGAPVDLFASADLANAAAVVDAGHADGEPRAFAGNALNVVVPARADGVDDWTDLAQPDLRIVAAGDEVPITRYANQLVAALGELPDAPAGFVDAYEENVVSREDNVRAVLAKIELGEGDAAIVYETDAATSDDVRTVEIPDDASVVAEYWFIVPADASSEAADLAEWLVGPEAQAILAGHGFRPASG